MTVNTSDEGEVDFEGQLTVPSPPSLRRAPVLPLHLSRCSDADFCGYFFLHVRVLLQLHVTLYMTAPLLLAVSPPSWFSRQRVP